MQSIFNKILKLIFLFTLLSSSKCLAIVNIQDMINQAKDGDTIVIPSGIYEIKDTIKIEKKRNLNIEGGGLVIIENKVKDKSLFFINYSQNITISNVFIVNYTGGNYKDENSYRLISIGNSILNIKDCEIETTKPFSKLFNIWDSKIYIDSSLIRIKKNYLKDFTLIHINNRFYSDIVYTNNIFEFNNLNEFSTSKKINYLELIDKNNIYKKYYYDYNESDFKKMKFYSMKIYNDESIKTAIKTYSSAMKQFSDQIKKSEFEKTPEYNQRIKILIEKMNIIDKNLESTISEHRRNEVSNLHNKYVIDLRKSLKTIDLDIINLVNYIADEEFYFLVTNVGKTKCKIPPNHAKSLNENFRISKITGLSQKNSLLNTTTFYNLNLKIDDHAILFKCDDILIKELKSEQKKVSSTELITQPKTKATKAENDKFILLLQPKQKWRGTYTCNQGSTNLDLKVREVNGNNVTAEFDFNFNNHERGSFLISGVLKPATREIVFKPQRWINQHSRYSMVGMTGQVSDDGKKFTGKINFAGCSSFDLSLLGSDARKSDSIIRGPKQW